MIIRLFQSFESRFEISGRDTLRKIAQHAKIGLKPIEDIIFITQKTVKLPQ